MFNSYSHGRSKTSRVSIYVPSPWLTGIFSLSKADKQLDRQARKDRRTRFAHERFWGGHQVWLAE